MRLALGGAIWKTCGTREQLLTRRGTAVNGCSVRWYRNWSTGKSWCVDSPCRRRFSTLLVPRHARPAPLPTAGVRTGRRSCITRLLSLLASPRRPPPTDGGNRLAAASGLVQFVSSNFCRCRREDFSSAWAEVLDQRPSLMSGAPGGPGRQFKLPRPTLFVPGYP